MMMVRLSTKGQIVIPRQIRQALGLEPGAQFDVRLEENEIVFAPLDYISPVDQLYGKYRQVDLLAELEADHQRELLANK